MELIRRDTDYAFRLVAQLTNTADLGDAISARVLAKDNQVSYALTCKILQKLARAGIVESVMGPTGGFRLAKSPEKVQFKHIIEAVQGPVCVNKCLLGGFKCPLKKACPAHPRMAKLQAQINGFLKELTLQEFINEEAKYAG